MQLAHRTITNSLSNFIVFFWSILVAFILTPFVLHSLGDAQYGVYAILLSVIGILSFLDLGLASASVRFIAEAYAKGDMRQVNKVITSNLMIFFGIGVGALILVTLFTSQIIVLLKIPGELHDITRIGMYLAVGSLLINLLNGVLGAVPQALQRYNANTLTVLISAVVFTIILVIVLFIHPTLLAILIVNATSSIGLFIGYILLTKYLLPEFRLEWGWDPVLVKKIFSFAGFTFIAMVAGNMLFQVDKFIISAILGSTIVTFYALPVTIAMKIHSVIANVNNIVFPLATDLFTRNQLDKLRELYIQSSKFTYVFVLAMVVPLVLYADPLIEYWLGIEYVSQSAMAMKILVLGYGVYALTAIPFYFYAGFNLPKVNMMFIVVVVVTNIIGIVLLTPVYNISGAALAFLLAQWVIPVYIFMCERKLQLSHRIVFPTYLRLGMVIVIGGGLMWLSLPFVNSVLGVILALVVAGSGMIGLAFVCKVFSKTDQELLSSYLRKFIPSKSISI